MRQRLALAHALPWLRQFLRALAGEGRTVLISSHVLSEVQQTVDEVVVIARGRLVRQGSLSSLEAGPTAALVRTPTPDLLREALTAYVVQDVDGRLRVEGAKTDAVGHLAHARGIELHELAAESSDLERLFLEMTAETSGGDAA